MGMLPTDSAKAGQGALSGKWSSGFISQVSVPANERTGPRQ